MPAGQIIGRVSVKVLPDTTGFARDAEERLRVIEKRLSVTIGTKIDMAGAMRGFLVELRRINQENRAMDSRKIRFHTMISTDGMNQVISKAIRDLENRATGRKVKINADLVAATAVVELDQASLEQVRRDLEDFRKRHSPLKIEVKPELVLGSTTVIEKRLDYLTRPRRIQLLPNLNTAAVTKVATGLAALSGARLVSTYFRDMVKWLTRLDKTVPLIGSVALAVAGLAGWGLTAASNLFALSASLARIGPLALVLPGILGGLALGITTAVLAFKDFNTVLPEVKAQFTALQDAVSTNFWAIAQGPIRDLVNSLLPQLSAGMQSVATQLGGFFADLAGALNGVFDGALAGMFADLGTSITIATGATGALANILLILGQVGAGYLPQLAQWFVNIANQFNSWLSAAATDGRLVGWIDTALVELNALWQVLANTGRILAGLAQAASTAGGSTLSMLADTLARIAATVNSPAFQTILVGVLTAAHQAMSTIATSSGPAVAALFQTLATTLTAILPMVGTAIGTLLSSVATALASPAIQTGLLALFQGIGAAVQGLAPAFGPVSQALGSLGGLIGTMLATFGPLIGTVFGALAQVLSALLPALQPLIALLGGALTSAFQTLTPVIVQVAGAVSSLISGGLMPALQTVIAALVPVVAQLGPLLGQVLVTAISALGPVLTGLAPLLAQVMTVFAQLSATVLPQLMPLLTTLGQSLGQLLPALGPLIAALLQLVMAILVPLLPIITQLITTVLPPLIAAIGQIALALVPVIQAITTIVGGLLTQLSPAIAWVADLIGKSLVGAIEGIVTVFKGVVDVVMGIFNTFAGLFTGDWSRMWEGIKQIFSGLWDIIVGLFDIAINVGVLAAAKRALSALAALWDLIWSGIQAAGEWIWNSLTSAWANFLSGLRDAPRAALTAISNLFSDAWAGILSAASAAWTAIRTAFVTGVNNARMVVAELPGKARDALGDLGSILVNAGKTLITGFISGITSMFGSVKSTLGTLTASLTSWKGPESVDRTLLVDTGRLIIDGLITGLESRYDAVRRSLATLTADIGAMVIDPPGVTAGAGSRIAAELTRVVAGSVSDEGRVTKVLNYYAAPGGSLDGPDELFKAVGRARMVGW